MVSSMDKKNDSAIPPIAPPQPDKVMNNNFATNKAQTVGKGMWQGQEMAAQRAARQMSEPTSVPGQPPSGVGAYGEMFPSPFNQGVTTSNPEVENPELKLDKSSPVAQGRKDGDDASVFGSIVRSVKKVTKGNGRGNDNMDGPPPVGRVDYSNHPEVKKHLEHAKKTNKQ